MLCDLRKDVILGHIPIQANRFHLANVKPINGKWTRNDCNWIHALIVDKTCSIRIPNDIKLNKIDIVPCEIVVNGIDIGKQLSADGFAVYSAIHFIDTSGNIIDNTTDTESRMSSKKKAKSNKQISNANTNVSCQIPKSDITKPVVPTQIKPTAKFDDDNSVDIMSQNEYRDYFDTAAMNEFTKDLDALISSNHDNDSEIGKNITDSTFDWANEIFNDIDCISSDIINVDSDTVENVNDDDDDENKENISGGSGEHYIDDDNSDTDSMSDTVSVCNPLPNTSPFTLLRIPTGAKGFYAKTYYIADVVTIMVEPELDEMTKQMEKLKVEIQSYIRKSSNIIEIKVGMPCLAIFDEDKQYYRAIVESYDNVLNDVTVLYADYLNSSVVKSEFIRKCPDSLLAIPTAVTAIRLNNVKKNPRLRSLDVTNKLAEILDGLKVYVKIIKNKNGSTPKVEVFANKNETVPIYQKLIDDRFLMSKK